MFVQEFPCEICGGTKYRGRREFERHFREWKHQNAMRALGIPNNKNFFEITKVADAQELWENIQARTCFLHLIPASPSTGRKLRKGSREKQPLSPH